MNILRLKPLRRQIPQHEERDEIHRLNDRERRLGLRRRESFQRRQLLERLHDQHEDVEVLSDNRRDDVRRSPTTGELAAVERA